MPAVVLLDLSQTAVVLRRRDDGGQLRPPLFRPADFDDRHAIGLFVHLLQVLDVLRVVDEEVVVADVVAELFFGGRDPRLRRLARRLRQRHRRAQRHEQRQNDQMDSLHHGETSSENDWK